MLKEKEVNVKRAGRRNGSNDTSEQEEEIRYEHERRTGEEIMSKKYFAIYGVGRGEIEKSLFYFKSLRANSS